jgi:hypothetical protein
MDTILDVAGLYEPLLFRDAVRDDGFWKVGKIGRDSLAAWFLLDSLAAAFFLFLFLLRSGSLAHIARRYKGERCAALLVRCPTENRACREVRDRFAPHACEYAFIHSNPHAVVLLACMQEYFIP